MNVRYSDFSRARRLLSTHPPDSVIALSYFGECSTSELRQALECAPASLHRSIEELNSLFLLQAGRVTEDEPRFSIPNTARIVVLERAKELARDHVALADRVRGMRTPGSSSPRQGNRQRIGAAIAQANAKLRDGDSLAAIAAVKAEMGRQGDHPDLLTMLGRCLAESGASAKDEARAAFRRAFERSPTPKEVLFDRWFEFEASAEFGVGMSEVADLALSRGVGSKPRWRLRYLHGEVTQAASLQRAGDYISSRTRLERTANGLAQLISEATWVDRQNAIDLCRQVHDLLWTTVDRDASVSADDRLRIAYDMIRRHDFRALNYQNLVAAAKESAMERMRRRKDEQARSWSERTLAAALHEVQEASDFGHRPILEALRRELEALIQDLKRSSGSARPSKR